MGTLKGIDISSWQKSNEMNWSKLAKEIDFAIIRTGYGNSTSQIDSQFEAHMSNAIKSGVKRIGVYHFNYCRSIAEAKIEAQVAMQICSKFKKYISFIAFDWEYDSCSYCQKSGMTPTRALVDSMAAAFKAEVEKNGYKFVLYTNPDYGSRYFTLSKYDNLWIAQYASSCSIQNADIWQYTSTGRLSGYNGNLDVNICYNTKLFNHTNTEEKIMGYAVKSLLRIAMNLKIISKVTLASDAVIGTGTQKSLKEVQKILGLKQTGEVDEKTVQGLTKLVEDKLKSMKGVTALQQTIAGV